MKTLYLSILFALLLSACSSKSGRGIELVSPCACYEIEKITSHKG